MIRRWWLTLEERQRKYRLVTGKEYKEPKKRNPYRRGAKAYLASFVVGEEREFNEDLNWDNLRSIASNMKRDFGCTFSFRRVKEKRFVTRVL